MHGSCRSEKHLLTSALSGKSLYSKVIILAAGHSLRSGQATDFPASASTSMFFARVTRGLYKYVFLFGFDESVIDHVLVCIDHMLMSKSFGIIGILVLDSL